MRILIVEDQKDMARTLVDLLKDRYAVDLASTGRDGIYRTAVNAYDLVLLDLGLPDMDGVAVCSTIRQSGVRTPILVLTGNAGVEDKVRALDACADDYLTKPFSSAELLARIRALLRRSPLGMTSNRLQVADLVLDTASHEVTRQGLPVKLGRREFDLLEYLMRHAGTVVSRSDILEHVWDSETDSMTNFIDVNVKYLRDKIDKPFDRLLITTVRGYGYKIA